MVLTTPIRMGRHFGDLATIRGILYYRLSPHEQKPFAGAITKGLPNFIPRTTSRVLYWLPPFIAGYLIYTGTEEAHRMSQRKNPSDYIDEVDPSA